MDYSIHTVRSLEEQAASQAHQSLIKEALRCLDPELPKCRSKGKKWIESAIARSQDMIHEETLQGKFVTLRLHIA